MTQDKGRSRSIDVVRGLALLIIFVDHTEMVNGQMLLRQFTLMRWGLSDALEVFIFLSGYVSGIVYSRTLSSGFAKCQWKASRRAVYLAAANLAIFVAVLCMAWAMSPPPHALAPMGFKEALSLPVHSIRSMAIFRHQQFGFDLLPLYAVILVFLPAQLWLMQKSTLLALWLSANLYCMAQAMPQLNLYYADSRPWVYNPLAWQFLFFCGALISTTFRSIAQSLLTRNVAAVSAALFAVLTFYASTTWGELPRRHESWLLSKQTAGPIRLLHFAMLAIPTAWLLNRFPGILNSMPANVLERCGRHSLAVFALGLIMTYLACFTLSGTHAWLQILTFEIVGIAAILQSAYFLDAANARTKLNPVPTQDRPA